jgi:predicted AlkP superfamily phosphohydrolase/phosphomutase
MSRPRILIIGLDGATWDVLGPQIEQGAMPCLARMRTEGTHGVLTSTLPPLTAPAWSSFQTGVNPGKHAVFDFVQYVPGSYQPAFVSSRSIACPTIWELLGNEGIRMVVVGIPMSYPPQTVNGVMVSGLLTPSLRSPFTHPPHLKQELMKAIGEYRFVVKQEVFFLKGLSKFLDELIETEKKRVEAAQYLLERWDWDIAMIQIQSMDNLQHALWPLLNGSSSQLSQAKTDGVGRFFEFVNSAIEALRGLAGDDANTFVISDHGFGPLRRIVYLNEWLSSKGFLRYKRRSLRAKSVSTLLHFVRSVDALQVRRLLFSQKRMEDMSGAAYREMIEWRGSAAFVVGSALYGGIRLNVQGREPEGVIPSSQYDVERSRLIDELVQLQDSESGTRPVRRVHLREEIYQGQAVPLAPDMLVEPEEGYIFSGGLHPKAELFRTTRYGRDVVGTHRMDGVYVLHGPAFRASEGPTANIVDIPATILALFGMSCPEYFDGIPMEQVFSRLADLSWEKARKPDVPERSAEERTHAFSEEDEKNLTPG